MSNANKLQAILFLSKQVRKASSKFWLTTVFKELIINVEYFLVSIVITKTIVNGLLQPMAIGVICKWIAAAAFMTIAKELFLAYYNNYIYNVESVKIETYFSGIIMEKSGSVDLGCYDDKGYYDDYIIATKDIGSESMKMVEDIGILIGTVALIALTSTFVIMIDPVLLLFVTAPVIGDAILRIKISNTEYFKKEAFNKIIRRQEYIKKVINDVAYAEEVRLYSLSDFFDKRFAENMREEQDVAQKHFPKLLRLFLLSDLLYEPKNLLVILYLAYKVIIAKSLSAGDFIAVQTAVSGFGANLGKITQRTTIFNEHALCASRYISFIGKTNTVADGFRSLEAIKSIEFDNISFRYTSNGPYVLKGISFKIAGGEQLALVGKNGQGKSTIIKLLLRFYDATEGKIYINGYPIDEYMINDLRQEVSYLSQQFHCYKLSLSDNLLTEDFLINGNNNRMLGVDDIIDSLPQRGQSFVGKDLYADGVELSRGQQQRIATARAVNKGGSLLVLDEPTAALDPLSETKLMDTLKKLSVEGITIVISHNLNLIKNSTKIVVLDDGQIKEMGTHDCLLSKNGLYSKMYKSQIYSSYSKNGVWEE